MSIFNTVPPLAAGPGIHFDGEAFSTGAVHRNLLDNSDFTHLVAQAGIGGNHGTVPYAADRWILISGSVSYAAGVGLTLNGTIKQKLEFPPSGNTSAFVGMVSGSASISYADGAVTITSSGGVLKWAALYPGVFTGATMPEYQPNGYAAELMECRRYFYRTENAFIVSVTGSDWLSGGVQFPITMITAPSIFNLRISDVKNSGVNVATDATIVNRTPDGVGAVNHPGAFSGMTNCFFNADFYADL